MFPTEIKEIKKQQLFTVFQPNFVQNRTSSRSYTTSDYFSVHPFLKSQTGINDDFNSLGEKGHSQPKTQVLGKSDVTLTSSDLNSNTNIKNWTKLKLSFDSEYNRIKSKRLSYKQEFESNFLSMFKTIGALPMEECGVEYISRGALKFTIKFSNDRVLMLTRYFVLEEDENPKDIIYSFFINKTLIASDINDFENFIENFKGYFSV